MYNGEIYNFIELRDDLIKLGYNFRTTSDTEVLLYLFIHFGLEMLDKIKGFYSFVILDIEKKNVIFLEIGRELNHYFIIIMKTIFCSHLN